MSISSTFLLVCHFDLCCCRRSRLPICCKHLQLLCNQWHVLFTEIVLALLEQLSS